MSDEKKDDGWIEWGGGEMPVPTSAIVEVKFRNEDVWECKANDVVWGYIIAYRVVPTTQIKG